MGEAERRECCHEQSDVSACCKEQFQSDAHVASCGENMPVDEFCAAIFEPMDGCPTPAPTSNPTAEPCNWCTTEAERRECCQDQPDVNACCEEQFQFQSDAHVASCGKNMPVDEFCVVIAEPMDGCPTPAPTSNPTAEPCNWCTTEDERRECCQGQPDVNACCEKQFSFQSRAHVVSCSLNIPVDKFCSSVEPFGSAFGCV